MTGRSITDALPLLRVPPFPGARAAKDTHVGRPLSDGAVNMADLLDRLRAARVCGTYWAAQPELPSNPYLLLRPSCTEQAEEMLAALRGAADAALLLWLPQHLSVTRNDIAIISGDADPWHMLSRATALWTDGGDETAFIAALLDMEMQLFGASSRFAELNGKRGDALQQVATREFLGREWRDPFTGAGCAPDRVIGYHAEWRRLIDANRPIKAAYGFGQWKQDTVDALLWDGSGAHSRFEDATTESMDRLPKGAAVAVWKARVPESFLTLCEASTHALYEVEDGFIRSVGLGADCVPPLSIVVDPVSVHYDPACPSSLENLVVQGNFAPELLARARQLRELVVESRISKYDVGGDEALARPGGARRHILVTGQVEDDRSVLAGGGDVRGNLDLLRRTRDAEPDAYILYKPHPDVLAGHRKGHVPEEEARRYADAIATGQSISALLDMVDGVHVMTSLAGFEALMRGKAVTTHGVPFYAGWGLTTDLGPVPERRKLSRTLDELVAATLLLYPRYLDPVTGLPCPPEILIERLKAGARRKNTILVMLRRAQGNLRRLVSGLRQRT